MVYILQILILLLGVGSTIAGPYSSATEDLGHPIDPGVPGYIGPDGPGVVSPNNRVNPQFVAWASRVVNYTPADGLDTEWSDPMRALGPVSANQFDIVSLGELDGPSITNGLASGKITLAFDLAIADGPGADFAIFENGFELTADEHFAELAYVEVSTDGEVFARFPTQSLTPNPVPFTLGTIDSSDVYNLAGKHSNFDLSVSWGTPFDLGTLTNAPANVDINDIRFVRLIDIPGNGDFVDSSTPPLPIYDVWPTVGSGGFDLEAIGVINHRIDVQLTPGQGCAFFAQTNRTYQVQFTATLNPPDWQPLGVPVTGDNQMHQRTIPSLPANTRFYYRLAVDP